MSPKNSCGLCKFSGKYITILLLEATKNVAEHAQQTSWQSLALCIWHFYDYTKLNNAVILTGGHVEAVNQPVLPAPLWPSTHAIRKFYTWSSTNEVNSVNG